MESSPGILYIIDILSLFPLYKRKAWSAWSEEETKSIEGAFCDYILRRVACPTSEITRIIKKISCLERRDVPKVKDKLNNIVRKTKGQYG